jgi:hypothetical protein
MFTAENEDVLVQFQSLCRQYPRENAVVLWEMAGGKFESAQPSVQMDSLAPRAVENNPDPQSRALTSGSPIHASH